jgi:hypothetical protein
MNTGTMNTAAKAIAEAAPGLFLEAAPEAILTLTADGNHHGAQWMRDLCRCVRYQMAAMKEGS